ncbi:hypothetical protein CDD83_4891 [Cordyceps sp. RAO-2017]|nr:hypothetical protein CDD83_4891 [Cordyceps sp. RAO-2017]
MSKAVKNVLAREDDDLRDQLPSPSRAQSEVVDPDEDELAAAASEPAPNIRPGAQLSSRPFSDLLTEHSGADTRVEDEPAIDWWQLLNPWTYVQAMAWIAESAWQRSTHLFNAVFSAGTRHHLLSAMLFLPYIVGAMLALILGLALSNAAIASFKHNSAEDLWAPAAGGASWLWAGGITRKLGAIFPTVSWSSRNRWDDLKDLWEADDFQLSSIEDYVRKIEQAFQTLRDVSKLHDVSLKKLESVVPWVVHMQVKDGKPTVAPEFWHALRDLIHEDGAFLTFERKRGGYEINSEQQWRALAARLVGDATFTNKLNLTIREAENRLNGRLTLWETWVRENDAKVKQSLGSAVDQIKSASSQPEWDDRLRKAVDEQVKDRERQGVFVGRDEYLRHVQDEVASHLSEFRAELAELKPHLEQFVRESVKLASAEAPASMSREDVTALVNGLVRKAFADMNLEALANGKIHVHWDTELRNHVNYLSIATGAVVDMAHSSNTYDPRVRRYGLGAGGREGARPRRAHVAALEPWQEDGECWCAARSRNRRGNPHGASIAVHLGYRIVPQHVVVEHILPGATTEPGARPRDVELYAAIEDAEVRERVLDFAATHFPAADEADWNHTPAALPARFAKIGQFVYEGAELHGGVHVHRLSSELLASMILVRVWDDYLDVQHDAPNGERYNFFRLTGRASAPSLAIVEAFIRSFALWACRSTGPAARFTLCTAMWFTCNRRHEFDGYCRCPQPRPPSDVVAVAPTRLLEQLRDPDAAPPPDRGPPLAKMAAPAWADGGAASLQDLWDKSWDDDGLVRETVASVWVASNCWVRCPPSLCSTYDDRAAY